MWVLRRRRTGAPETGAGMPELNPPLAPAPTRPPHTTPHTPRPHTTHTGFMPDSSMRAVRKNMPCRWLQQRYTVRSGAGDGGATEGDRSQAQSMRVQVYAGAPALAHSRRCLSSSPVGAVLQHPAPTWSRPPPRSSAAGRPGAPPPPAAGGMRQQQESVGNDAYCCNQAALFSPRRCLPHSHTLHHQQQRAAASSRRTRKE